MNRPPRAPAPPPAPSSSPRASGNRPSSKPPSRRQASCNSVSMWSSSFALPSAPPLPGHMKELTKHMELAVEILSKARDRTLAASREKINANQTKVNFEPGERGRWRGRLLSGGGRRRAALTAPLPAAPRWRSWHQLRRAAALAAAWRSAAALLRRRFALSAQCVVLSSSRSMVWVVGAVASFLGAVAVARRSRRRCLRRYVGVPGAGSIMPSRSRRRDARPPLFRGGDSLSRRPRATRSGSAGELHANLLASHRAAQAPGASRQSPTAPPSKPLASASRAPDLAVTTHRRRSSRARVADAAAVPATAPARVPRATSNAANA